MTVYLDKRLGRWRFDFWRQGIRYQGWCLDLDGNDVRTKTAAREAQERFRARVQSNPKAAPVQPGAAALAHAMAVYMAQLSPGRHAGNQQGYVTELLRWFGPDQRLDASLTERVIGAEGYIAWARRQPVKVYQGGNRKREAVNAAAQWKASGRLRTDATINRYLDCLRRAVRLYGEPIDPATGRPRLAVLPSIPSLDEPKRKPRPIPDGELQRILAEAAPWLADAALIARLMGFRRTEMLAVPLADVDLEHKGIWLRAADTKGGADDFVPANKVAMAVLRRRYTEAERIGSDWLFWYVPPGLDEDGRPHPPRPLKSIKRAWKSAQRRAGLKRTYRIHDLKAAFVTSVAPHGPPQTTQKLGRHAEFATTQAYLGIFDQDARDAVEAMGRDFSRPKPVRETVRETGHRSAPIRPQKARSAAGKSKR